MVKGIRPVVELVVAVVAVVYGLAMVGQCLAPLAAPVAAVTRAVR